MIRGGADERKAVALSYDPNSPAPFVLAKGKRELAEKLLATAREHGIEIVEEAGLLNTLFEIEVGDFIPEELYEIMAQILAFIFGARKVQ